MDEGQADSAAPVAACILHSSRAKGALRFSSKLPFVIHHGQRRQSFRKQASPSLLSPPAPAGTRRLPPAEPPAARQPGAPRPQPGGPSCRAVGRGVPPTWHVSRCSRWAGGGSFRLRPGQHRHKCNEMKRSKNIQRHAGWSQTRHGGTIDGQATGSANGLTAAGLSNCVGACWRPDSVPNHKTAVSWCLGPALCAAGVACSQPKDGSRRRELSSGRRRDGGRGSLRAHNHAARQCKP